jgi:hypothetical protein
MRTTDRDADLSAQRYDVYESSTPDLDQMRSAVPVYEVDASGNINDVRYHICAALLDFFSADELFGAGRDGQGDISRVFRRCAIYG